MKFSKVAQKELLDDMMMQPVSGKSIGIAHLELVRESQSLYGMKPFHSPENVVELVRPLYEKAHREMVLVLTANSQLEIQALEIAAVGGLNVCHIEMKELFKLAIVSNAAYILCLHNHPSGYPNPSQEDNRLTEHLRQAGELLGIPLLDHIIVGVSGYYSYRNAGVLRGGNKAIVSKEMIGKGGS